MQHCITNRKPLLNNKGELNESGYATSLILDYNRKDIKANKLLIKEWDYYCLYNEHIGIALTIDDNSYMGLTSVSFIDFDQAKEKTVSLISLFTNGSVGLPASSKEGNVIVNQKKVKMSFLNDGKNRRLKCTFLKFDQGFDFSLDVTLSNEPRDSMVIAMPFAQKKTAFYYNQKIIGMKVSGTCSAYGKTFDFNSQDTLGLLDWGRGVWTYDNVWYWGAAQGYHDNKVVGFNIGYGFGDCKAASENMLFYDGVAHKIEDVQFNIPMLRGTEDYLSPWTFSSSDGRFEMSFIPILDRAACTSVGVIISDQHQVFGRFSGKMILDDQSVLEISSLLGFAEKVHNKW